MNAKEWRQHFEDNVEEMEAYLKILRSELRDVERRVFALSDAIYDVHRERAANLAKPEQS